MWHQTAIRLRTLYPKTGIGRLCDLFGKTRHAFYDRLWHSEEQFSQEQIVVELLLQLKRDIPGAGLPTLYSMLRQPLISHGIKMGRDALQDVRRKHGLIQRPRRNYVFTTDSAHRYKKYPNIVKELQVIRPEHLWVSDITYLRVGSDFNFLSLITDAYSRKIVGYHLHTTLSREGPLKALNRAIQLLQGPPQGLIHHSDRGTQYCCDDYIDQLNIYNIGISMTAHGDPYENALAERINGILKETFGLKETFSNTDEAEQTVVKAIGIYNNVRPHTGINGLTPAQAHKLEGEIPRKWKKKVYKIKAAGLNDSTVG
jgi:transposase InsO family protein